MKTERPTVIVEIPERRTPGKISKSDQPSAPVYVKLDSDDYNWCYQRAKTEKITIPEVLRRALKDLRKRSRHST